MCLPSCCQFIIVIYRRPDKRRSYNRKQLFHLLTFVPKHVAIMLLGGLLLDLLEDKGSDTLAQLKTVQLCLKAGLQCRSGLRIFIRFILILFFCLQCTCGLNFLSFSFYFLRIKNFLNMEHRFFRIDLISVASDITIKSGNA